MTKTTEVVVLAYKKENNPNKKVKILAICHLLKNKKNHHRSIENIIQGIQYDQELVAGI